VIAKKVQDMVPAAAIAIPAMSLLGFLTAILLVRLRRRSVASFHRVFTNRIMILFAARLPNFAIVENVGRKSGKLYRTPVNVFCRADKVLIVLPYGKESEWVKNVVAAGGCQLETRGMKHELAAPILVNDRKARPFPWFVRTVLRLIDASDYIQLSMPLRTRSTN